jgi:hypothetical protein
MLPDSNVNEPASHGFVKFKINQLAGNERGTLIENRVGIIFDFNEPIITNKAFNTVGIPESFKTISFVPDFSSEFLNIKAYPNPFTSSVTIEIEAEITTSLQLELVDAQGKQQRVLSTTNNKFTLQRNNLAQGIYLYTVSSATEVIGRGKLVVE